MRPSFSTGFRQFFHGFLICPIICPSFIHHFSIICSSFSHHLFIIFSSILHHFSIICSSCSIIFSIILHHFSIIFPSLCIIFFPSFSITFPSSVHHVPSFSPSFFRGFASFFHVFPSFFHHFPLKKWAPGRLQERRAAAARSRERAAGAAFAAVAGAMA
jgi:hypothetical protein